jgi:hypothetical protein
MQAVGLLLRLTQDRFEELFVHRMTFSQELTVLDEIDQVLACDSLGVEGMESQVGFTLHISR